MTDAVDRIKRDLGKRRTREADINYRIYVRPFGDRGLHVVKRLSESEEYVVSGPQRTFRPGTIVPTGSWTGNQGETILIEPPPGRRGNPTVPKPPSVIQPSVTFTVFASGEVLRNLSSPTPIVRTINDIGSGPFDPDNWIELYDVRDDSGNTADPGGVFEIVGRDYISSTTWSIDLWVTAVTDWSFKLRIWNKQPALGGTYWKEHLPTVAGQTEPWYNYTTYGQGYNDYYDNRYVITAA